MVVGAVGPDAPEPAVIPFVMVKDPAAGNVEIRGAVGGDTLPDPSVRRTAHDGIVRKIKIANTVFRPVEHSGLCLQEELCFLCFRVQKDQGRSTVFFDGTDQIVPGSADTLTGVVQKLFHVFPVIFTSIQSLSAAGNKIQIVFVCVQGYTVRESFDR